MGNKVGRRGGQDQDPGGQSQEVPGPSGGGEEVHRGLHKPSGVALGDDRRDSLAHEVQALNDGGANHQERGGFKADSAAITVTQRAVTAERSIKLLKDERSALFL